MDEIGSILKRLRVKKNITLEQLATNINERFDINITTRMLEKWENGKAKFIYIQLKCFALYYNVTTDFLLGFDQEEYQDLLQVH